jgi:hypothetical protein
VCEDLDDWEKKGINRPFPLWVKFWSIDMPGASQTVA